MAYGNRSQAIRTACTTAAVAASLVSTGLPPDTQRQLDRCDVVWDTVGKSSADSMPIGNGDIGLNVWTEPGGHVVFYLGKTDAWSGNGRLLKVARVRVTLSPDPFADPEAFTQRLRLHTGEIRVEGGRARMRLWVDANRPVIHIEVDGDDPLTAEARLEPWRTEARQLTGAEAGSAYGVTGGTDPIIVEPDTVLPPEDNRLVWYHRNTRSCYPVTMRVQALGDLLPRFPDPLLDRTFGGMVQGEGMAAEDTTLLVSQAPAIRHHITVHILTAKDADVSQWHSQLTAQAHANAAVPVEDARRQHRAWWDGFWSRSWIFADAQPVRSAAAAGITANELPLRLGADSDARHRFLGRMARVSVFARALTDAEVRRLAETARERTVPTDLVALASWHPGDAGGGMVPDRASGRFPARVVGETEVVLENGHRAMRFAGHGYLEVAHAPLLALTDGFTLEAWIAPDVLPASGARIIDKSRAGTANGYLLDTYPGNSLRSIIAAGTLGHKAGFRPGAWVHVAAVCSAETAVQALFINGKRVAQQGQARRSNGNQVSPVTRGYTLQRFINACAGRGAFPVKFNGSLFTVDTMGDADPAKRFDADYRRWGGCYWFQNTRLPYWSMLHSGDWDHMAPLFRMYTDALPLARERTRRYFGHGGAFFPETMTFWGTWNNDNYGWKREGKPDGVTDNRYIRYYWQGALELCQMMLDVRVYTGDPSFATTRLLPIATEVLRFYAEHYPDRNENGKVIFRPAQSLETWHDAVDPLPVIAGLRVVLTRLLQELPSDLTDPHRAGWRQFLDALPDLPVGTKDGKPVLLPAVEFRDCRNVENPELYAVFPYRLFGVGKPDLELARNTFAARRVKRTGGWFQDAIQAALLGLTDEAAACVYRNLSTSHVGSRFPAFWGPNFDWVPDQDHGGVSMTALQRMLIQCEDDEIRLLPAWPAAWDVDAKLHAPRQTTVRIVVRDGALIVLDVAPAERRRHVVLPTQVEMP